MCVFYTKILEVNFFAFAYRLLYEDFSSVNGVLHDTQPLIYLEIHSWEVDICIRATGISDTFCLALFMGIFASVTSSHMKAFITYCCQHPVPVLYRYLLGGFVRFI